MGVGLDKFASVRAFRIFRKQLHSLHFSQNLMLTFVAPPVLHCGKVITGIEGDDVVYTKAAMEAEAKEKNVWLFSRKFVFVSCRGRSRIVEIANRIDPWGKFQNSLSWFIMKKSRPLPRQSSGSINSYGPLRAPKPFSMSLGDYPLNLLIVAAQPVGGLIIRDQYHLMHKTGTSEDLYELSIAFCVPQTLFEIAHALDTLLHFCDIHCDNIFGVRNHFMKFTATTSCNCTLNAQCSRLTITTTRQIYKAQTLRTFNPSKKRTKSRVRSQKSSRALSRTIRCLGPTNPDYQKHPTN